MAANSTSVRVFAPAKINLFLHVGDKRADGYHALQSLAVFAEVGDELEIAVCREYRLSIRGPFAAGLSADGDNLVLKTAQQVQLEADIVLTKNLPVASGIGGGSADAAATLRGLARVWNMRDGEATMRAAAAQIGSDVPVCMVSRPAWMEGRGEIVSPVAGIPRMPLLLVNPGVAVSTAEIFRALGDRRGIGLCPAHSFGGAADLLAFLHDTANDLEAPARAIKPVIGEVLDLLGGMPGALLARMSGSGATCFALFESAQASAAAAHEIAVRQPGWWVRPTRIAPDDIGTPQ
jgi:4-diphosphocytidyl-2-C-methyl-D-erythritol kinase